MWGRPPFFIAENFSVEVDNLDNSQAWYREKLGFRTGPADIEDDSGRPFVALQHSDDGAFISLVEKERQSSAPLALGSNPHPIFFAAELKKAHDWLENRGVAVEPIQADSGGNQFFKFRDLQGNSIEVCQET